MKRRVIAIAVVLAVVGVVWLALWRNEGPLWHAVMLKRVVNTDEYGTVVLRWEWRLGEFRGEPYGAPWTLQSDGIVYHHSGGVSTLWNSDGKILGQGRSTDSGKAEEHFSPPWWPHPPLIDLREFEE